MGRSGRCGQRDNSPMTTRGNKPGRVVQKPVISPITWLKTRFTKTTFLLHRPSLLQMLCCQELFVECKVITQQKKFSLA